MRNMVLSDDSKNTSFIITKDNSISEVSSTFFDMTGFTGNLLLGKNIYELNTLLKIYPPLDAENINTSACHYLFTSSHDVVEFTISVHKIHHEKKSIYILKEISYSRLEEKFPYVSQLYTGNKVGIAIFAMPDIILLKANQYFLDFFDPPFNRPEFSIGKRIDEFVTGWSGSTSEEIWKTLIETGEPYHIDEYMYDKFARGVVYLTSTLTPIFENDSLKYVIELTSDITERVLHRKQIEEQSKIIEQQKNELERMIGVQKEFFSFISHEFKTPLSVINAAVQAIELMCSDELSERAMGFIKTIKRNSLQQLRLVNNLLDITRYESGYLKLNKKNADIVMMTRAITESVGLYAKAKGVDIKFSSKTHKKLIAIDDEKFERILLNLLSNAIKFTPAGGCVYVNLISAKEKVLIAVRDEGIGIPRDKQNMIFERFMQVNSSLTRQSEGTGIGLSLARLLVRALDGEIILESAEGKGSTFTVILPASKLQDAAGLKEDLKEFHDNRLIQSVNIEFSSIYID